MAADKLKFASGNSASTTSSSSISNSDTSLPLTSDTAFAAESGEGMVIIDEGTSNEELAYATGKSGSSLTIPLANRGLEGGSAKAHDSGVSVKGILSAGMWNDLINSLADNVLDKTAGTLKLQGTATVTDILDEDNMASDSATALATQQSIKAYADTLNKQGKKTITSNSDGATITFDLDASNIHTVTLGDNRTLALSNASVGQVFIINLVQDGTGSRTVTWFSTIKWAGGSAPTLTTTADKTDSLGFICTSSGNYLGYVVGQNL